MKNQNHKTLPKGWRRVKLREVAGVLGGFAFKSGWFNNQKIGAPVIKIQNITDGVVDVASAEYVDTTEVKRDISKFRLKKGDFLVAMTGATSGKVGLLVQETPCYLNQRVGKFYSKNVDVLDKKYLYYSVINPKNLNLLKKLADGSAQGNMSSSQIENALEIILPQNLDEQKCIASILSAFDEKIELNNKISRTLEEMASTIFKEWFVDFRFPGYERAKFIDSESEKIPEGWRVEKLGDGKLSEIISSGINKFDDKKIYLATADVVDKEITTRSTLISYENRPSRANMQPVLNSVWFARMVDTYKVLFFFNGNKDDLHKYILSTGFAGLKCLRHSHFYLYLFISSKYFHKLKNNFVTGGVQRALPNRSVSEINILAPPEKVLIQFNKLVEPLFNQISHNKKENLNLASLRDLLLPKLMSGEVRV